MVKKPQIALGFLFLRTRLPFLEQSMLSKRAFLLSGPMTAAQVFHPDVNHGLNFLKTEASSAYLE